MPTKQAAFKALRQTKKHAERNTLAKLQLRDARRAVRKALASKEAKKAEESVKKAIKLLDKAYSRGIMKLNAIAASFIQIRGLTHQVRIPQRYGGATARGGTFARLARRLTGC